MLPKHPNQLLQTTLDKLSHELHANMDNYLLQMKAEQQALINDALSQLIPRLLTKLMPIIEQEVKNQNQPMLTQVEAYLNELKTTNQQQLKNAQIRQRRISRLTDQDTISLEPIRQHTIHQRQRNRKVAHALTNTNNHLSKLTTVYDEQTNRFIQLNQRARKVTSGYGDHAQRLHNSTNQLKSSIGVISDLAKALIEPFKQLFTKVKQQIVGYAKAGILHEVDANGKQ